MTWWALGTTVVILPNLNMAKSHVFIVFLGRKLPNVEFGGLIPMNYFEVICWPSRRRTG